MLPRVTRTAETQSRAFIPWAFSPRQITTGNPGALRGAVRGGAVIEPDRDHFLYAARRLAAKNRNGLADPEEIAIELGIGLYEVTELVRRYQDSFDWASVPIGKLRPR